jgi:hypothetical protein
MSIRISEIDGLTEGLRVYQAGISCNSKYLRILSDNNRPSPNFRMTPRAGLTNMLGGGPASKTSRLLLRELPELEARLLVILREIGSTAILRKHIIDLTREVRTRCRLRLCAQLCSRGTLK